MSELSERAALLRQTADALELVDKHGFDKCVVELLDCHNEWAQKIDDRFAPGNCYRARLKPVPKTRLLNSTEMRRLWIDSAKLLDSSGIGATVSGFNTRDGRVSIRGVWLDAESLRDYCTHADGTRIEVVE